MASFIDASGARQQLTLEPTIYRQAAESGLTLEAFINQNHPVAAGAAPAFDQLCASEGMFVGRDSAYGIRPAALGAILNGTPNLEAGAITKDAVPASRILFPAFQMSAIENKLKNSDYGILSLFNSAAAVVDTIADDRFERPILNFSKAETPRMKPVAPLSEPASMMTVTVSDKSMRITGKSIGAEVEDRALRGVSLDLFTMGMTRQAEVEMQEEVETYMLNFLNGDADLEMGALSGVSGAVTTAQSFDSTISTAGVLTQKAWVKWLFNNSRKRKITHIICTLDTALAIENRTGRNTVQTDNATSKRIDTLENIINPMWPDQVNVLVTMDPNFPANTILGFDSNYGYHVVNSSVLDYNAAESYAIRRSTKFRIDRGMIAYRLFDDAWSVLTLTT